MLDTRVYTRFLTRVYTRTKDANIRVSYHSKDGG
jgi:hypothetical protein